MSTPRAGYIKFERKAFAGDPLWDKSKCRSEWEARADLFQMAPWRAVTVNVVVGDGEGTITVPRGHVLASVRMLAKRWGWSIPKVVRFMAYLVNAETIREVSVTPAGKLYVVVNYDVYQGVADDSVTPSRPSRKRNTKRNTPPTLDVTPNVTPLDDTQAVAAHEDSDGAMGVSVTATVTPEAGNRNTKRNEKNTVKAEEQAVNSNSIADADASAAVVCGFPRPATFVARLAAAYEAEQARIDGRPTPALGAGGGDPDRSSCQPAVQAEGNRAVAVAAAADADAPPAPRRRGATKTGAAKPAPKYPHYSQDQFATLWDAWTTEVGTYDAGRFRRETAGLFLTDPPRYPVEDLASALKLCITVTRHHALAHGVRYPWERLTPAVFAGRVVEWVGYDRRRRGDAEYLNKLLDAPLNARLAASGRAA